MVCNGRRRNCYPSASSIEIEEKRETLCVITHALSEGLALLTYFDGNNIGNIHFVYRESDRSINNQQWPCYLPCTSNLSDKSFARY